MLLSLPVQIIGDTDQGCPWRARRGSGCGYHALPSCGCFDVAGARVGRGFAFWICCSVDKNYYDLRAPFIEIINSLSYSLKNPPKLYKDNRIQQKWFLLYSFGWRCNIMDTQYIKHISSKKRIFLCVWINVWWILLNITSRCTVLLRSVTVFCDCRWIC